MKSKVRINFLPPSADKFATDFELVLANSEVRLVSQQETRMMRCSCAVSSLCLAGNNSSETLLYGGAAKSDAVRTAHGYGKG